MVTRHRIDWHPEKIFRQLNTVMAEVSKEGAEDVAKDARRLFKEHYSQETGESLDSIRVEKSQYVNGGFIILMGGGQQFHMSFLELGADNLTAKPFLRPALNKNKRRIRKKFRDALKDDGSVTSGGHASSSDLWAMLG